MKSKEADRSVKNSGLKTSLRLGNFFCKSLVVPGTTVDLTRIILSGLVQTESIFFKTDLTIERSLKPSLSAGVGTDKKMNSELLTVS